MDLLTQTTNDFAQWRSTRTSREQTPDHLKRKIVILTESYSKSELCQALNINNRLIDRCLQEQKIEEVVELSNLHEQTTSELEMAFSFQGIQATIKGLPQDIGFMIHHLGAPQ